MSSDLRRLDLPAITRLGLPSSNQELLDRHLFSFYFTLPLIGVCLALLRHNWYALAFLPNPVANPKQVPGSLLCRRHFLLFRRNGFCSRRHPRSFQQDSIALLYPANLQLPPINTTTVRSSPKPTSSNANVCPSPFTLRTLLTTCTD